MPTWYHQHVLIGRGFHYFCQFLLEALSRFYCMMIALMLTKYWTLNRAHRFFPVINKATWIAVVVFIQKWVPRTNFLCIRSPLMLYVGKRTECIEVQWNLCICLRNISSCWLWRLKKLVQLLILVHLLGYILCLLYFRFFFFFRAF
jgi:hypothetical protein